MARESLRRVLTAFPVDILHANHTVLQPTIAADVCPSMGILFVIYPHGSDIEYTIRQDRRFTSWPGEALTAAAGVITGSREMLDRLLSCIRRWRTHFERNGPWSALASTSPGSS